MCTSRGDAPSNGKGLIQQTSGLWTVSTVSLAPAGHRGATARHNRTPAREGLENRPSEAFGERWVKEQLRLRVQRFKVRVRDIEALQQLLLHQINVIEGVRQTRTVMVLSTAKEECTLAIAPGGETP